MITLDVTQGSPEWHAARLGTPTASRFSEIITAKTGKPSDSARKYVWELCAEWLLGAPLESASTDFMERGTAIERQAIAAYKIQRPDVELTAAGFCLTDDRSAGCSPDRLVGDDGGLEIKCPGAKNHLGYVLGELGDEHRPQVQGCLWITGRSWWDQLSFHPELPPALVRYKRDEYYIAKLAKCVEELSAKLATARAKLLEMGFEPRAPIVPDKADVQADPRDVMFAPPTPEQARVATRTRRTSTQRARMPDAGNQQPAERYEITVCYVAGVTGCTLDIAEAAVKRWMAEAGHKLVNFGNDEAWRIIRTDIESRDWAGACAPAPNRV